MQGQKAREYLLLLSDQPASALATLQAAAAAMDWGLEHRLLAQVAHANDVDGQVSRPLMIIVDGRGGAEGVAAALNALHHLNGSTAEMSLRLLLLDDAHPAWLDGADAAGATHIMSAPFDASDVQRQFRMMARLVQTPKTYQMGVRNPQAMLLPDRRINLQNRVQHLLRRDQGFDPAVVLLLIRISHFERYNSELGTDMANRLLVLAAERIGQHLAEERGAFFARQAGAEFATILSAPISIHQALHIAERIAESFDAAFFIDGQPIYLACRIGVAPADAQLRESEALFRHAHMALEAAHRQGPNSVQLFLKPQQGLAPIAFASLEQDLRNALDENGLDIFFQPQVDIARRQICGLEALVRWDHVQLGAVAPEMILAIAARAEFSERLGRHIIGSVLEKVRLWPASMQHLHVSINVTATDLQAPDFENFLLATIREKGINPKRITLELTEGVMVENIAQAVGIFARLRLAGLGVAIDDFGTGYSSLAYLTALPLDYLKIDKKLITDVAASLRERVVVRGIVDMARSLGLCVVAEGVENEAQLEQLAREGVNWYQGYLCAAPMENAALASFVDQWSAALEPRKSLGRGF